MSITAEKVEQVARIIDPHKWSLHDAAVGDLYAGYRKSLTSCSIGQATAILSLLQQGEPEGWREAKRIADLWFEPWGAAKAIEWEFSGDVPFTPENALRKIQRLLSASPLPPAPGAETPFTNLVYSGWLIERDCADGIEYVHTFAEWTRDANKALRFHRKGDAEDTVQVFFDEVAGIRVVEHAWDDGNEPQRRASSSRQAALEEAARLVKSFWITAKYDYIGDADVLESVCAQASEAILALATTPPAEGERK